MTYSLNMPNRPPRHDHMSVIALRKGRRIRHVNWYWGKFITYENGSLTDEKGEKYSTNQIPQEFEIYNEETHGLHNERN